MLASGWGHTAETAVQCLLHTAASLLCEKYGEKGKSIVKLSSSFVHVLSLCLHSLESVERQCECEDGEYEMCLAILTLFLVLIWDPGDAGCDKQVRGSFLWDRLLGWDIVRHCQTQPGTHKCRPPGSVIWDHQIRSFIRPYLAPLPVLCPFRQMMMVETIRQVTR